MDFSTALDRPDGCLDRPKCLETLYPQGLDNFSPLTTKNVYIQKQKKSFRCSPYIVSRARRFALSNLSNLSRPNSDRPFRRSAPVNLTVRPVKVTPC